MSDIHLTVGLTRSPYTEALFDGSARPKGIELKFRRASATASTMWVRATGDYRWRDRRRRGLDLVVHLGAIARDAADRFAGVSVAPFPAALHVLPHRLAVAPSV